MVVEIHSPGDEAYEKLRLLRRAGRAGSLGHPPRQLHAGGASPQAWPLQGATGRANGWIKSTQTGIELAHGIGNKLAIRLAGDDDSRHNLPEE